MRGIRSIVLGVLVAAGFALAPSAFARGHGHVSIGIGLPGLSIGWSDCRHCGHGWAGNYYYGGHYGGYYTPSYYSSAYYGPTYYDYYPSYYSGSYYGSSYYGPSRYYSRPRVGVRYYNDGPRHDRGRHNDRRDYGHRASYYDRGRDYRH